VRRQGKFCISDCSESKFFSKDQARFRAATVVSASGLFSQAEIFFRLSFSLVCLNEIFAWRRSRCYSVLTPIGFRICGTRLVSLRRMSHRSRSLIQDAELKRELFSIAVFCPVRRHFARFDDECAALERSKTCSASVLLRPWQHQAE
jgi:hypothetical protein